MPRGWVRIPDDAVRQMTEALIDKQKTSITYDAGFQPGASARWFQCPYVLVQAFPYSELGLRRQIKEREFGQVIKALTGMDLGKVLDRGLKDEVRDVVSGAQVGTVDLDRVNHRFTWAPRLHVAGVGEVRGDVTGYFGRDSLVHVMFYDRSENWPLSVDIRSQIRESFRFDPEHVYDKAAGASGWLSGSKLLRDALVGGVVGVIVASILGVLRSLRAKRSRTSGP